MSASTIEPCVTVKGPILEIVCIDVEVIPDRSGLDKILKKKKKKKKEKKNCGTGDLSFLPAAGLLLISGVRLDFYQSSEVVSTKICLNVKGLHFFFKTFLPGIASECLKYAFFSNPRSLGIYN